MSALVPTLARTATALSRSPLGPREVKLVPAVCRLVARQYCDQELHQLADMVEAIETG